MPTRRKRWALVAAASVAVTLALPDTATAAPEPSAPDPGAVASATTHEVTLVTGDVVTVTTLPGQDTPAYRLNQDGPSRGVATVEHSGTETYVVPLAAQQALVDDAVDLALFDVDKLVADGFDDAATKVLPLVLDNAAGGRSPKAQGQVTSRLDSIDSLGVDVPKAKAAAFWGKNDSASERHAAGVDKIWLDAKVQIQLKDSVPQIGAPQLWAQGYDGAGVTVAVLDTGVDTQHPDLAGRVSKAVNFTGAADAGDHFGHGTHVAATIGGSGAGNGAKGVAPHADLISGKVLDDTGSGSITDIVEGMQWAAESGAAIVNMSLGTPQPDDGHGPLSSAIDQLTERYGTLFVVAAGNSGPNTIGQPASAKDALTVGAVDKSDALATFSSTGPRVGDYAVKPEVSAPGVNIVAARASGTTMGTPVDDLYTTASGTSMATPHVAGAAALVKQVHPDWTWQQLKAALVGSADEGAYRVENGGAGRVDVPRAAEQNAYALPTTVNLGTVRYAESGQYQPVTAQTVIHNDAATARTFTLTAAVTSAAGATVPQGTVRLSDTEVTVPAGGSTPVTLTVDPNLLTRETFYSGIVTAVATDSSAAIRVPVSVYVEPLLYDVTVRGTGTDGKPVAGNSLMFVYEENSYHIYRGTFNHGVATVRVKPGTYAVQSLLMTPDAGGVWVKDLSMDVKAGVDVTSGDVSFDLDAGDAAELTFRTGRATEWQGGALGYWREPRPGAYHDLTVLLSEDFQHVGLFPIQAPAVGTQEITVHSTLTAPVLTAKLGADSLHPSQLDAAKRFEGTERLTVVDVGDGSDAGFGTKDVRHKLVLATPTGTVTTHDVIENAARRGATAVAIGNDVPGRLVARVDSQALPAFALPGEDADRLHALAVGRKPVVVDLVGTPRTPYVYNLVTPFANTVPAGPLAIPVDDTNSAKVTVLPYERGTGAGGHVSYTRRGRAVAMVGTEVSIQPGRPLEQWVSADPSTRYQNASSLGDTGLAYFEQGWHTYTPGSRPTVEYFKAVNNARINQGSTYGNRLYIGGSAFPDGADPSHQVSLAAYSDAVSLTLDRDGQRVGESIYANGSFTVPDGDARYEAVLDARRTTPGWEYAPHAVTKWSFRAAPGTGTSSTISMPQVGYGAGVDLHNKVPAGRTSTLTVTAQPWQQGGAAITEVHTWISYDDGTTWREATLTPSAQPGVWTTQLPVPEGKNAPSYVSLRTTATDTNGHTVDQTVDRAFGVTRNADS